jgi:hypothetical protein
VVEAEAWSSRPPSPQDEPSRPGHGGEGRSVVECSTFTTVAWPAPGGWDEGERDDQVGDRVARIAQHNVRVDRFDAAAVELLPGQRVRARVLSHEPWGVMVEIIGHEQVGASIDMAHMFGRPLTDRESAKLAPAIGAEIDAVVQQVRRWHPPVWVRLSIRPSDLESFQWRCDFCADPTMLSPGGDGVVLDVRSNDGPGSHSIVSHRACLADSLHPTSLERSRVARVGRR